MALTSTALLGSWPYEAHTALFLVLHHHAFSKVSAIKLLVGFHGPMLGGTSVHMRERQNKRSKIDGQGGWMISRGQSLWLLWSASLIQKR